MKAIYFAITINFIFGIMYFIPGDTFSNSILRKSYPQNESEEICNLTDSIKGTYLYHSVRYSEEIYNEESGIKAWHSLESPDTTLTIKLSINEKNQFVEHLYGKNAVSMFAYKNKGGFFELTGNWSFSNDTLLLTYTNESVYKNNDKSTLIEEVDLIKLQSTISDRRKSFVLINSSRLCIITKDYGTYCFDKKITVYILLSSINISSIIRITALMILN